MSFTDRLFCCITTIQSDLTHEMLQAVTETLVTLYIIPETIVPASVSEGILRIYLFTYSLIDYFTYIYIIYPKKMLSVTRSIIML